MVVCAHLREMTSAVYLLLVVISAERQAVTFQRALPQKRFYYLFKPVSF